MSCFGIFKFILINLPQYYYYYYCTIDSTSIVLSTGSATWPGTGTRYQVLILIPYQGTRPGIRYVSCRVACRQKKRCFVFAPRQQLPAPAPGGATSTDKLCDACQPMTRITESRFAPSPQLFLLHATRHQSNDDQIKMTTTTFFLDSLITADNHHHHHHHPPRPHQQHHALI